MIALVPMGQNSGSQYTIFSSHMLFYLHFDIVFPFFYRNVFIPWAVLDEILLPRAAIKLVH